MDVDDKTLRSVKKHSEFFVDLAIQEYELNKTFRPSVVAISSIFCARKVSKIIPEWNNTGLEELTDYTYDGEVKKCTEKLLKIYLKQFALVKTPASNNKKPTATNKNENPKSNNKSNKEN